MKRDIQATPIIVSYCLKIFPFNILADSLVNRRPSFLDLHHILVVSLLLHNAVVEHELSRRAAHKALQQTKTLYHYIIEIIFDMFMGCCFARFFFFFLISIRSSFILSSRSFFFGVKHVRNNMRNIFQIESRPAEKVSFCVNGMQKFRYSMN